jgi:hypothetical protein
MKLALNSPFALRASRSSSRVCAVVSVADPVPRKISDFLSNRQFQSLGLHSEFFQVFDVNYQMAMVVQHAGQRMIGVAANRTLSDFTERERECLGVLRSHVVQAYRHGLSIDRVRAGFHFGPTSRTACRLDSSPHGRLRA